MSDHMGDPEQVQQDAGLPLEARQFLAGVLATTPGVPEPLERRLLELAERPRGGRAPALRRAFEELSDG
jgi:hypothetical protein